MPSEMNNTLEVVDQLAALQKQRATIKGNISRIRNMYQDGSASTNPIDLECRLEILTSYIKQIMAYQTEIEKISPDDNKRGEIEEVCIGAKSLLLSKLGGRRQSGINDFSLSVPQAGPAHRLPNLKIPKFSGKYSEYKNFIACFNNLVHDDPHLSVIEKFNHLINSLQDDALRSVKAFQITEANYQSALDRLAERYDKKSLIFKDHVTSLFEIKKMSKPSSSDLRNIVDTVSAVLDSLIHLGTEKDIMNAMVIHLVLSKIDCDSKIKWDEQLDYNKLATWNDCSSILIKRCEFLEINEDKTRRYDSNMNQNRNAHSYNNNSSSNYRTNNNHSNRNSSYSYACSENKNEDCSYCKRHGHLIENCNHFSKAKVQQRFEFVKANGLCLLCLRTGHSVKVCRISRCRLCNLPHHILLHNDELVKKHKSGQWNHNNNGSSNGNTSMTTANDGNSNGLHCCCSSTSSGCANHNKLNTNKVTNTYQSSRNATSLYATIDRKVVVLATAIVKIKDKRGKYHLARALLDSGSQVNLITEEVAQKLYLSRTDSELNIVGVGNNSRKITKCLNTFVKSNTTEYEFSGKFYVMKSIIHKQPSVAIDKDCLGIPSNIVLADPEFNRPQRIDMLIGAESFFELLSVGQIKLGPTSPILQKTLLGWIVSGRFEANSCLKHQSCQIVESQQDDGIDSLNKIVEKFWELEQVPTCSKMTEEHLLCESHFLKNTVRIEDGRFEVRLPFKTDPSVLGNSYEIAMRRFLALERKVNKNPDLKSMYIEFMNEYLHLGHMSPIDNTVPRKPHYFIPHQCVIRAQSTTTKLRVVFDASSKTSTLISLNDTLMVGPTIQKDLFSALLQFRLNRFAITADITKMYRQVRVHKDDRMFQLILWRERPDMPIQIYQLNTVTYGTAPAPFLAIRCLKEISDLFKDVFPLGSSVVAKDFYVDDLLSGADDVETLVQVKKEVIHILNACGFNLAKWYSNCKDLNGEKLVRQLEIQDSDSTRALGITWKTDEDSLCFNLEDNFCKLPATKRNILSISSRLFDPLGLLAPIVIKAKMLLQRLWELNLDWDESIPQSLETDWHNFRSELSKVHTINVPRFVGTTLGSRIQIHGFADASMKAYGCCIYVKYSDFHTNLSNLVVAKSKVAPSKKIKTLPRLELCAAHLLAKLWCVVKTNFEKYNIENVNFWSDSEIVLHWLKTHPSKLHTFVSNRVAEIQEISSDALWRYVPSAQNPADIVSRGCDVNEIKSSIWFDGPNFIKDNVETWPKNSNFELPLESLNLEKKKETESVLLITNSEENNIIKLMERKSSLNKLIRIVAYILRFIKSCRANRRTQQKTGENIRVLDVKERELSFVKIVEIIQTEEFKCEINCLETGQILKNNSIQKLNPFIQKYNLDYMNVRLLRVGGRLSKSDLPYEAKYPLLLKKSSHFVKIYFRNLHMSNCHIGANVLLSISRERIWVVNGRELARKTVRNCIPCFRYKPKLASQIMADLPKDRITGYQPFRVTGVDLCGPIYTTLKIRGKRPVKTYIAVFICFASKAVHLEALSDLTTDCFLSTLNRFVGRRGLPKSLWCDNATNFQGTAHLWTVNDKRQLKEATASKGMDFHFIPPRAPHFGGLWEAAVKAAKSLLVKTLGEAHLTFEELTTILVEIEAVLNSRPIVAISEDPNDEVALTPGHLLIGRSLKALPEIEDCASKGGSLNHFRRLSSLRAHFWDVWRRDYVASLQCRGKWREATRNIEVGEVVVIHDDNMPPQKWLVGRIIEVEAGADGKVRVATVKTPKGIYKRPIVKLAPLPMEDQSLQTMDVCKGGGVTAHTVKK